MSDNYRQRTIQLSLIVFCCLFVAATRTEVPVDCQSCTCIVGCWFPPPQYSWYQNQQVAVRIDDAWDPVERGYLQEGIEKWSQGEGFTRRRVRSMGVGCVPGFCSLNCG